MAREGKATAALFDIGVQAPAMAIGCMPRIVRQMIAVRFKVRRKPTNSFNPTKQWESIEREEPSAEHEVRQMCQHE